MGLNFNCLSAKVETEGRFKMQFAPFVFLFVLQRFAPNVFYLHWIQDRHCTTFMQMQLKLWSLSAITIETEGVKQIRRAVWDFQVQLTRVAKWGQISDKTTSLQQTAAQLILVTIQSYIIWQLMNIYRHSPKWQNIISLKIRAMLADLSLYVVWELDRREKLTCTYNMWKNVSNFPQDAYDELIMWPTSHII